MRTVIEGPLLVHADGTSSVPGSTDVVRVSDHYSACFVTRTREPACWGIATGGTWNGVAKRDPAVGLEGVVDIAINQTHACAALGDGSVSCWAGDGIAKPQVLPGRARELSYSMSGRVCAALDDGTVASTRDWTKTTWSRVEGLRDVAHLLTCDSGAVCGELSNGTARCAASPDPQDPRGIAAAQAKMLQVVASVGPGSHLAMNDYATAFCAYGDKDVRCVDATSSVDQTVPGLRGVQEIALGTTSLAGKLVRSAACARLEGGGVRCWNLEATPPALVDPTVAVPAASASGGSSAVMRAETPSLRVGQVTVNGRLPVEVIQRIVRLGASSAIVACYRGALARSPHATGDVVARFVIENSGAVSHVEVSPGTLADPAAAACIAESFKHLSFPTPEAGNVTVAYPMTFGHLDLGAERRLPGAGK
jgi:hypothetical protein